MKKVITVIFAILIIAAIGSQVQKKQIKKNPQNQTQTENTSQQNPSSPQAGTNAQATSQKSNKELVLKDLSYGSHTRNTMNILIPKGSNNATPFILLIHGGAWYTGDKNDLALIQLALATKGIASASMNYRYASSSVDYTDLMSDVKKAVDFIESKETEWNIDTDTIAIGGASAGAHMALLYAYGYDGENRISSVISLAGPTDITDVALIESVTNARLIQGLNDMVGDSAVQASPINRIKNVPTLLVHGTKDTIVPYAQATLLEQALINKGVEHKLLTIQNANHDLGIANPNNVKKIIDAMGSWIKAN